MGLSGNKDVETPRCDLKGESRQLGVSTYELDGVSGFSFRGCLVVSSMVLLRGIRSPTYGQSSDFALHFLMSRVILEDGNSLQGG